MLPRQVAASSARKSESDRPLNRSLSLNQGTIEANGLTVRSPVEVADWDGHSLAECSGRTPAIGFSDWAFVDIGGAATAPAFLPSGTSNLRPCTSPPLLSS